MCGRRGCLWIAVSAGTSVKVLECVAGRAAVAPEPVTPQPLEDVR